MTAELLRSARVVFENAVLSAGKHTSIPQSVDSHSWCYVHVRVEGLTGAGFRVSALHIDPRTYNTQNQKFTHALSKTIRKDGEYVFYGRIGTVMLAFEVEAYENIKIDMYYELK